MFFSVRKIISYNEWSFSKIKVKCLAIIYQMEWKAAFKCHIQCVCDCDFDYWDNHMWFIVLVVVGSGTGENTDFNHYFFFSFQFNWTYHWVDGYGWLGGPFCMVYKVIVIPNWLSECHINSLWSQIFECELYLTHTHTPFTFKVKHSS